MREISENALNILKSQNMTGQNKFNYDFRIEGYDPGFSIPEKSTSIQMHPSSPAADYCIRSDGKILYMYRQGNGIYKKVIDSEEKMLSENLGGTGGTLFYTVTYCPYDVVNFSLLRLKNGQVLLFLIDAGSLSGSIPFRFMVYRSISGTGDDFVLQTNIVNFVRTIASNDYIRPHVSKAYEDDQGNIFVFGGSHMVTEYNYNTSRLAIYKSIDAADTWSRVYTGNALTSVIYPQFHKSIVKYGNLYLLTYAWMVDNIPRVIYSSNSGNSWSVGWLDNLQSLQKSAAFAVDSIGDLYLYRAVSQFTGKVFKYIGPFNPTFSEINFNANWQEIISVNRSQFEEMGHFTITPRGTMVIFHGNHAGTRYLRLSGIEREQYGASLNVTGINISKGKGGANTLDFTINNAGAIANPFNPDSPLFGILGLNKQIILKQGYGGELVETFTGLIDSVKMRAGSDGYLMDIHARDALKYALDQTITEAGRHTVNFTNQPIENIFGYLCYLGGFETGVVQTTGIQISKEFTWTTYADAFQFLADLASFEYGADEYGKIYFRRDEQTPDSAVAYTFEEGVDIMGLSYSIDDDDLYNRVHVYGKSGDTVIQYIAPFLDAAEYGVFPQKVLKIDVTEASTVAEIRKIAERAIYVMRSRAKRVEFEAVGVPWLQVGDFIGVYERSTMASGIYRITGLNSSMDNSGFTMRISAFYYGDSIVPGELPETPGNQTPDADLNIIPEMTSNTTPEGIARASSVYTSAYAPWQAFNSHSNDLYWNAMASTGWIEYQFPEMMIVDKYMLKARQLELYNAAMPRDWKFEGFDGEKWVVLHTVTNQTSWGVYEERTFEFENETPYAKYRLNVSRNNGYIRLQLEQLAFYYRGGV